MSRQHKFSKDIPINLYLLYLLFLLMNLNEVVKVKAFSFVETVVDNVLNELNKVYPDKSILILLLTSLFNGVTAVIAFCLVDNFV